jgi:hypothetical protein
MKLPELSWDWPEIAVILHWKLAPLGYVLYPEDLVTLPTDRVLLTDRKPDRITLTFISVESAKRRAAAERGETRATVSELQGRWEKIAVCMLWHFAQRGKLGKRDSITLTEYDRQSVPGHLQLMATGHAQGVEWRFLDRAEAARLAKWDKDNEGAMIQEQTQC